MIAVGAKHGRKVTAEQWRAIRENDTLYDDRFYYAVKTTKIFCRPSCKSRVPNVDNVTIFYHAQDAMKAGYRPCKRCKSGGYRLPDEEWVLQAEAYIIENFMSHLTLDDVADGCHGSPYHLHRVFKRINGFTPLEYLHRIRIDKAKKHLRQPDKSISEIAALVGIPNATHFATVFKKWTNQSPREYRKKYRSEVLQREI